MGWYHIPDAEKPEGSVVVIEGGEARHMAGAARVKPGETITLFDGGGTVLECDVLDISPKSVEAKVTSHLSASPLRRPWLDVAVGLVPLDRLKEALAGAIPSGIRRFVPVICERSQAGRKRADDAGRMSKALKKTAVATSKQAECPFLPLVSEPVPFRQLLLEAAEPGTGVLVATSMHPAGPPSEALASMEEMRSLDRLILLIGPEGGFSGAEYDLAASSGARFIRFAPYIYRTELAACALTVSVRACVGW